MLVQLNPPLPVNVINKGAGFAFAVIDYGQEHNLIWVTALNESGEIWCAPNPQVRLQKNWTMGRAGIRAPAASDGNGSVNGIDCSVNDTRQSSERNSLAS